MGVGGTKLKVTKKGNMEPSHYTNATRTVQRGREHRKSAQVSKTVANPLPGAAPVGGFWDSLKRKGEAYNEGDPNVL